MPDGSIFTGYYGNFKTLSYANKQAIFDERKRLGTSKGGTRQTSATKSTKKQGMTKMSREISALKTRLKDMEGGKTARSSDGEDEEETPQDDMEPEGFWLCGDW